MNTLGSDQSSRGLALTPEGQRRIPAIFSGVLDDLLSGFTPEEVGLLKSMLKRVLANADSQLSGPTGNASTSFCNGE
ncbi:hypothetical protein SAMN05192563_1016141 [Paraburkholderia aspalathi]|uniref:HTH marR-type domain-containing protein n=1 Tax=Paraburkholderia aspalathi TaxID=1324617 RepID=A0A1I7ECF3_9BURK|nr:hypothetical protein R20943_07306 [Paraburkholderia aspalathi]SFU21599.1 hypothetical protein SAMN05192563_1016141 [Paraburkholderia aspalathi]